MSFWRQDLEPRVCALQEFLCDQNHLKRALAYNIVEAQRIQQYHASGAHTNDHPLVQAYHTTTFTPAVLCTADQIQQCTSREDLEQLFTSFTERDTALATLVALSRCIPSAPAQVVPSGSVSDPPKPEKVALPGDCGGRGDKTAESSSTAGTSSLGALCASVVGKKITKAVAPKRKRRRKGTAATASPKKKKAKAASANPKSAGKKKKARKGTATTRIAQKLGIKLPKSLRRTKKSNKTVAVDPAPPETGPTHMDVDTEGIFDDLSD